MYKTLTCAPYTPTPNKAPLYLFSYLREFPMKIGGFIRRILCLFTHGGAQLPARVNLPPTPEPISLYLQDGTPSDTTSVSPYAQVRDGDVEILPQNTDTPNELRPVDSEKSIQKLLDLLVGHSNENNLAQCFSGRQVRLENCGTNLNVHVFVAQAGWSSGQEGSTNSPSQSSSSQNGRSTDSSSPPTQSGRMASDRSSQAASTPPTPLPQPLRIPSRQQAPVDTTPSFQPPHEFGAPGTADTYQNHPGGPGGGIVVMRANGGPPRSGPQGANGDGGDGADYQGGKQKFICETCGAPFSTRYNVERHQKSASVHRTKQRNSDSPSTCQQCGKQLSRRDSLRRHKRLDACGKRDGSSRQGGQGGLPTLPSPH